MSQSGALRVSKPIQNATFGIVLAVSFCHFLNDLMQTLLSSIYPILKESYGLDYWQIGLLTMAFQVTASLLQPFIGLYTDKNPLPFSLPVAMASTMLGLFILAGAGSYSVLLVGACFIGLGSA
ncbi:MAG TPA: MFS transporter, partial [Tianweitania sediminis]|nr:MFS transporter [Tianweitania sediminis]